MQAYLVDRYNSNERVRLDEVPTPTLRDGDVLVRVHAAGINPLDIKLKRGEFKLVLPYRLPMIPGNEAAGVVIEVGRDVRRFKPGDEVYARPHKDRIGTFAEFIAIDEADVAMKPARLTMEEAASIPLVGLTAWQALIERAHLRRGQKVFIQAGSGGVGTFAIQLAKHLGAVVATTTSASNIDLVRRLGADVVIDYKKEAFEQVLHDYDVVLNSQDPKTLERSLRILRPSGHLVSISGPPDPAFAQAIGLPWALRLGIKLLSAGVRRRARKLKINYSFLFMQANGRQLSEISALIDAGVVQPVIDKVFPFAALNEALAYVDSGRARGKVVVKMV